MNGVRERQLLLCSANLLCEVCSCESVRYMEVFFCLVFGGFVVFCFLKCHRFLQKNKQKNTPFIRAFAKLHIRTRRMQTALNLIYASVGNLHRVVEPPRKCN